LKPLIQGIRHAKGGIRAAITIQGKQKNTAKPESYAGHKNKNKQADQATKQHATIHQYKTITPPLKKPPETTKKQPPQQISHTVYKLTTG
jgi:hypothetical protein